MSTQNAQGQGAKDGQLTPEQIAEIYYVMSQAAAAKIDSAEKNRRLDAITADHGEHGKDLIRQVIDKWKSEFEFGQFEEDISIDSMIDFDPDEDPDRLIGNRWICKGYQAMIQGPTGIGKSSLIMQAAIVWVLGLPFFGIRAIKPLRVLIIQDENDLGDMAEAFNGITGVMKDAGQLTSEDMDSIRQNLIIKRVVGVASNFHSYLRWAINKHLPDLVIVDPLFAYADGDLKEQKVITNLLRNQINPVLRETGAALIWNHHISKPSGQANGKEESSESKKYSGFGSSEIQNVMRAVIRLGEISDGLFELHLSKRGRRAGLADPKTGKPITSFNIEYAPRGIAWQQASGQKATASKAKAANMESYNMVRDLIVEKETVTRDQLEAWASLNDKVGIKSSVTYAKDLVASPEQAPRIYQYKRPAPIDPETGKKAKGEQPTVWSIHPPPTSDAFGSPPTKESEFKASESGGKREVKYKTTYDTGKENKHTVTVKCPGCSQTAWAYVETEKPPGSGEKRACVSLSTLCRCPDKDTRFFVAE